MQSARDDRPHLDAPATMYKGVGACLRRPSTGHAKEDSAGFHGPSTPYGSFSIPAGGFDPRKDMMRTLSGDSFTTRLIGAGGQKVPVAESRHVSIAVPNPEPTETSGRASISSPQDVHEARCNLLCRLRFLCDVLIH